MLMKMRSRMQNQKGFTLVELMVVVVILGILVAIAVPIYKNVTANAEKNACFANQRSIEGAWMVYTADAASGGTGDFPEAYIVGATGNAPTSSTSATITMADKPTATCDYTLTYAGVASCANPAHNRNS